MVMPSVSNKNDVRNILLFLEAFLALGAVFGGVTLIISPSGSLLHMPLSMLSESPFKSFFLPGLILFAMLGIAPCIVVYALLKRPEWKAAERLNLFKDMY